jgi:hypothetical protein
MKLNDNADPQQGSIGIISYQLQTQINHCDDIDNWKRLIHIADRIKNSYREWNRRTELSDNTDRQKGHIESYLYNCTVCSIPELQEIFQSLSTPIILTRQELAFYLKQLGWTPKTNGKQRWWVKTLNDSAPIGTSINDMEV